MIIDAHVHMIALSTESGGFLSPKMQSGVVFRVLKRMLGIKGTDPKKLDHDFRKRLVAWAEESTVDALALLAFDGVYDEMGELDRKKTHLYVPNDYAFEVASDSDAFFPIASVNPQRRDAIDELERVVELGAVAIKTLPNSQNFDPGNLEYKAFWQRMADLDIPLLTHTSYEHTIPPYNQEYGKPERLMLPLENGVVVIAAHCASSGIAHAKEDMHTWLKMLESYPNLYGDISAMGSLSRFTYIHKVLASELAQERVIFGSDFPVPVAPMLFARKLGVAKARELSQIKNPIEKNYQTFKALGVSDEIMQRGAKILRLTNS